MTLPRGTRKAIEGAILLVPRRTFNFTESSSWTHMRSRSGKLRPHLTDVAASDNCYGDIGALFLDPDFIAPYNVNCEDRQSYTVLTTVHPLY